MGHNILYILGAFLVSTISGFIFIPQIMRFCKKKGLYDQPDSRKIHHQNIPRLGGISFLPSMLLATLIMVAVHNHGLYSKQINISLWSLTFLFSLLVIYTVGIIDDMVGLGAKTKFLFQAVAAAILPFSGLYINNLYGFCGIYEIPFYVGCPITIVTIIFACNSINLIDGIDGLSAGLSIIALTGFLVCFMRTGIYTYCILIAGLIGALVPFIYFNIWGKAANNRKIFMGDSGSLTLGFILGFLFVKFTMVNTELRPYRPDSLLLAYTLLIVPAFDVFRVTIVRLVHGIPIFKADKNHIHHKLLRAGFNQHQALCIILALALSFILINLMVYPHIHLGYIVLIDIAIWLAFHLVVNRLITRRKSLVFVITPDTKPSHDETPL